MYDSIGMSTLVVAAKIVFDIVIVDKELSKKSAPSQGSLIAITKSVSYGVSCGDGRFTLNLASMLVASL